MEHKTFCERQSGYFFYARMMEVMILDNGKNKTYSCGDSEEYGEVTLGHIAGVIIQFPMIPMLGTDFHADNDCLGR